MRETGRRTRNLSDRQKGPEKKGDRENSGPILTARRRWKPEQSPTPAAAVTAYGTHDAGKKEIANLRKEDSILVQSAAPLSERTAIQRKDRAMGEIPVNSGFTGVGEETGEQGFEP